MHPVSLGLMELQGAWLIRGPWNVRELHCTKRTQTILTKVTRQMDSGVSSRTLTSQSIDFLRPHGVRPNRTKALISSSGIGIPFQIPTTWELPPSTVHPMSPSSLSGAASTRSHGEADTTLETALKTRSCYVVYKHRKRQLAGLPGTFICQSGC